jgi:hypothetical protein
MIRIHKLAAVAAVALTLASVAGATHNTSQSASDRRAVANALVAFADALRTTDYWTRQTRTTDGTNLLAGTQGFADGNSYITNAYNDALWVSESGLKSARNWLNSYLILYSYRFYVSSADKDLLRKADRCLYDFNRYNYGPSKLKEAFGYVRDTNAFGRKHFKLSTAVNQLGWALEKRTRGYWWLPGTARYDANRARNAIRDVLSYGY